MKRKILLAGLFVVTAILIVFISDYNTNYGYSYSAGVVGATGSPADGGTTCDISGCHSSYSLGTKTGWITSNIPAAGYIAGQQYLITCTATYTGRSKFGFNAGVSAGTIASSDATTQISSNEVTHKSSSTAGTNGRSWNFYWTAPTTGSSVTFYAAFNCANGNNAVSGDYIYTSTLTVHVQTTGIADLSKNNSSVQLFPNPVSDKLTISYNNNQDEFVSISLYSIDGKKIMDVVSENEQAGIHTQNISVKNNFAKGLYFLRITQGDNSSIQKIIIQ